MSSSMTSSLGDKASSLGDRDAQKSNASPAQLQPPATAARRHSRRQMASPAQGCGLRGLHNQRKAANIVTGSIPPKFAPAPQKKYDPWGTSSPEHQVRSVAQFSGGAPECAGATAPSVHPRALPASATATAARRYAGRLGKRWRRGMDLGARAVAVEAPSA
jgi:hypothetical protein